MIRALVTGTLYGAPQARTSQAGKQFVTAKIRADGKDGATVWCSIIAFDGLADRLLALADGAALSVSGRAEVNGWLDKAGAPKAGLSLVADELATLKSKPRPPQSGGDAQHTRQSTDAAQRPRRAQHPPVAAVAGFDDELPDFM